MKLFTIFSSLTISILVAVFNVSAIAQEQNPTSISSELTTKCNNYPQQPNIPNGTKATMDEMVAAQKTIKAYQAEAQTYRSCIDSVMAAWDSQGGTEEEIGQKKDIAVAWYNRSIADEEEVANLFNTALRAYKGKPQ
ncbi:MAG: hypothetical protein A3J35_00105 [Gammaproteobacteria bacterium RIFCSPLOWO2_02_FULL_52_10]|nr:MAG: hypothetical protein A3J35_00105 [Gammaproteobacteria bacterium RIFCSPLOWO2_02_FULL_52_10]OGT82271.1 MAG: hypothetical protein A3G96_06420 [Gammaproteobacteria bacterium RIFCSPLOWO2_12_FULL_52_10]